MDNCGDIVNPYLACSDKLQQFRKFEIEEYRTVIRQLQTATAQWYLSILKDHEGFPDLSENVDLDRAKDTGDIYVECDGNKSLGGQDTLHLFAKNSRDTSSRGYSLRLGHASLSTDTLSPVRAGCLSSVTDSNQSPASSAQHNARQTQQPSLLDLCPSIFSSPARRQQGETTAAPEAESVTGLACSPLQSRQQPQQPPGPDHSIAKSLASLCPSIQHLLDGAEDAALNPANVPRSLSSGPFSSAAPHPKSDANAPPSMLDLQPSVIGCFESSSSDKSSFSPDIDTANTNLASRMSSCPRSTIPAFHQGLEPRSGSETSLASAGNSGVGAVTVFCHDIATMHSHEAEMISSTRTKTLCLDELSRVTEFGIQSQPSSLASTSGCSSGWPGSTCSLTRSESMHASLPLHSITSSTLDSNKDSLAPLRRAKSLVPMRRSMLTPAAACDGGHLLPEVPALQTYKQARPRRAHFKSSVMILDTPTVHMYEEDTATARMTVSAVAHPQSDGAMYRRRQHTRRRGSYMSVRSGLDCVDLRRNHGLRMSTLQEVGIGADRAKCRFGDESLTCSDREPDIATKAVLGGGEKVRLPSQLRSLSDSQVSCEKHGGLTASLEVLCQALIDSRHLSVCLELGLKLSDSPTWIEMLSLILRSLEAPANGPGRELTNSDISEVCHQVALVFFPIGLALTAMQRNLMMYVESAGCHAPRRSQPNQHVPTCPPLGSPAGSVYTSEHLADAWNASGADLAVIEFEGRPQEYLTQLLPRIMFDYISSLVSIGMRIDAVEQSHGINCSKALDIIKSQMFAALTRRLRGVQVGMTLEGLSTLTGTLVHSLMGVCQGNIASADISGLLSSLSPFLGVSLEHMAASVSLINGRLPLNTTDEALEELARTEHTWYQQRSASTAFFHCLSLCGHMLTILEGLEVDLKAWKRAEEDGGVAKLPGQSNASPMSLHIDSRVSGSPSSSSMHGPPREATSKLGYEWQVLFDVLPKVQATSSRLVMLVGSLILSASLRADRGRTTPSTRSVSPSFVGHAQASTHVSADPTSAGLSSASLQPPMTAPAGSATGASVSPLRMTRSGRTQTSTQSKEPPSHPSLMLSIPSAAGELPALGSQKLSGQQPAAGPPQGSPAAATPTLSSSMSAAASRTARRLFSPRSCLPCFSDSRQADIHEPDGTGAGPVGAARHSGRACAKGAHVLPSPGHSVSQNSLTAPPGLPRLQVGDGEGVAVLASPQPSAFVMCAPPESPGHPGTPKRLLSNLRTRSSTSRSFLQNVRSPSLAIEEPQHGFGALSSEEHPMSPIARQMMVMRIRSETRPPFPAAPRMAATDSEQLIGGYGSGNCSGWALETPPPSHRREMSSQSASAMLQPHANGDVSKCMLLTSLARALGSDSPTRRTWHNQTGKLSASLSNEGADLPTCLTVREVARVQAALARGVVSLGICMVRLLQQRCLAVEPPASDCRGLEEELALQRQLAAEVVTRCEVTAQAQLSMSLNMQRWTNVLPGPTDLVGSLEAGEAERVAGGLYRTLEAAAEELRAVAVAAQRRVGVSASEQRLGQGRLVELLLGCGIKPLGKKSLGSVWMHHLGRELVAVKWITIEDDPPGRGYTAAQKQSMLIREVEAMMRLKHAAIVQLLGTTTMVTPLVLAAGGASGHHVAEGAPVTGGKSLGSQGSGGGCSAGLGQQGEAPLQQATVGIVLELCMYGTLQDFLNQTRALFNNSSRIRAAPEGGLVLRQGACTSALEAMCLCFINSWSQRLRLCREIASALAACHAAGVLHRDLTSFNVMLSDMLELQPGAQDWALRWQETNDDGETEDVWSLPWATRLIDFGLSKHSKDQPLDAHASIDVHSIPWMAPEMFISTQHLKASDVYGLGMVIWEVLSTHKPPTSHMQTYIATGLAFSGATRESPGPCEAELSQLLHMHESGDTAVLMRKLHGVPCPVLPELVGLIRDTQRYRPQDRITAAEVTRRLAKLETACSRVPPGVVPREDQELARYWRETAEAVDDADQDLAPFSSTSSVAEADYRGSPWPQHIPD